MYIIAHATVFEELKGAKRRTWKLQQLFHTTFQRKLGFEFLRLSSKIYIYIVCFFYAMSRCSGIVNNHQPLSISIYPVAESAALVDKQLC